MKYKIIYTLGKKIKETWIEDFIDEDTGDIVSITRYTYHPEIYLLSIVIPVCKSKLDLNDIKWYAHLHYKINFRNVVFTEIISKTKFNNIVKKHIVNKLYSKLKYKLL